MLTTLIAVSQAALQPKAPNFQYFERYLIVNVKHMQYNVCFVTSVLAVPNTAIRTTTRTAAENCCTATAVPNCISTRATRRWRVSTDGGCRAAAINTCKQLTIYMMSMMYCLEIQMV